MPSDMGLEEEDDGLNNLSRDMRKFNEIMG